MRLVLAEDSVLLREGLCRLLCEAGCEVVGTASDGEAAVGLVGELNPDAVILDIRMPPSYSDEGLRAAKEIRLRYPKVAVLVLSQYVDTGSVVELLLQGSRGIGYLLKDGVSDLGELVEALRRIVSGGCVVDGEVVTSLLGRRRQTTELDQLSERERAVLELMTQGRSNHAIARLLFVSEKTVETHVHSIFAKLRLAPSSDDHRRVLAVLSYLRSTTAASA